MSAAAAGRGTWRRPPFVVNAWLRWAIYLGAIAYLVLALGSMSVNWTRLADGLEPFGRVQRIGAMLTLFAGREAPVLRFEELDTQRYGELFRGLLDRGVYVAPSQYECLFPSLAHDDDVIDDTIRAVSDFYEAVSAFDDGGNG